MDFMSQQVARHQKQVKPCVMVFIRKKSLCKMGLNFKALDVFKPSIQRNKTRRLRSMAYPSLSFIVIALINHVHQCNSQLHACDLIIAVPSLFKIQLSSFAA